MWFIEDAWTPIAILAIAGGVCLGLGLTGRGKRLVPAGGLLLAICPVAWLVERQIVTDAERIEQRIQNLADAFVRNDQEQFLAFFAPDKLTLRTAAVAAMASVDLSDLTIKDVRVTVLPTTVRTLTSRFRANANDSLEKQGGGGYFPSRWELDWQPRDGQWIIVAVRRIDPIRDEEIPLFGGR